MLIGLCIGAFCVVVGAIILGILWSRDIDARPFDDSGQSYSDEDRP